MDDFLKSWNEINADTDFLINLSSAIDVFEKIPACYLDNNLFLESFYSAKIVQQAVQHLNYKDLFVKYTAVKLISMICQRHPESIVSININYDELKNVELCCHFLKIIFNEFKNCSEVAKFNQLFHTYSKCINKVSHLCTSFLSGKGNIDLNDLLAVLQSCILVFKIYHKVEWNPLNLQNLEFKSFKNPVVDSLNELVHWLVNTNDKELLQKKHLVWRYVIKLLFKVVHAVPDENSLIYDPVIKNFCLHVSWYLRLNFIDNVKVVESNFTSTFIEKNWPCIDESTARKLILFGIKTMLFEFKNESNFDEIDLVLKRFLNLLSKFRASKSTIIVCNLINVFMEQDDEQVLILKLLLYLFTKYRKLETPQKNFEHINPHLLFGELLNALIYDELVLLDWLISVEADFVNYFKLYLTFIIDDFDFFLRSVNTDDTIKYNEVEVGLSSNHVDSLTSVVPLVTYSSSDEDVGDGINKPISIRLDKTMSCFIRLRLTLERMNNQNLLSMEVILILHLLEKVEDLYEC